jgi:hypothetical protein
MELTTEQKLAINIKAATDIGILDRVLHNIDQHKHGVVLTTAGSYFDIFNPDNTTDLNKAVEAYGIDVCQGVLVDGTWECWGTSGYKLIAKNKSRDESMRMAVVKASGVEL